QQSVLVGGLLEEYLESNTELKVSLHPPGKENAPVAARTQGVGGVTAFRWADTDQSGVYRLTVGDAPHEYLFAVNVPVTTPDQKGSECDLTRLTGEQLKASYPGWAFQLVTKLGDVRHTPGTGGEETTTKRAPIGPAVAHVLLLAVLGLVLVEVA